MVTVVISHKAYEAEEDFTILNAAIFVGIRIPVLCYLKSINEIGACRVCVAELAGKGKLMASCNNRVEEGMVVYTNNLCIREAHRGAAELILSQHDCYCSTCMHNGDYGLQRTANDLGILGLSHQRGLPVLEWNKRFPLIYDLSKCIRCMCCIQTYDEVQGMHIWDAANTGSRTTVDAIWDRGVEDSDCVFRGQCVTYCLVGALRERDDIEEAFVVLADPDKITMVQIAPSVCATWGEPFGLSHKQTTVKRLVAMLRKMGSRYIFDTNFVTNLTIMEEGSGLLEKLGRPEAAWLPMFASYCPRWARLIKPQYPDMVGNLSNAKSPQQMFGAMAKSYYTDLLNVDPKQVYSTSVMPCLAKKDECAQKVPNDAGAGRDADPVLTTRETDRMIRVEHVLVFELRKEEFDIPFGVGTGTTVTSGTIGDVTQATLRSAYYLVTGKNPNPKVFLKVGGMRGRKEANSRIADRTLRVAVVSELGNMRRLMESIHTRRTAYDFVEAMVCPGGCAEGGGQSITDGMEFAQIRGEQLYELGKGNTLHFSHKNPTMLRAYRDYFEKLLSEHSHKLLYTRHKKWECLLSPYPNQDRSSEAH